MSVKIIRETLSRGKRTGNSEWIYGIYSPYNWDIFLEREEKPQIIIISENKRIDGLWCEVIPETVGRFIGMSDKNGRMIFEGDVIKRFWLGMEIVYYVYYDKKICGFIGKAINTAGYTTFNGDGKKFEIIGNIHDSPELLETAAKKSCDGCEKCAAYCVNCNRRSDNEHNLR